MKDVKTDHKRVLVTGCSRGIGRETVAELLRRGHLVLGLSRNCAPLRELESDHEGLQLLEVDITNSEDLATVERFVRNEWGSLDVIVHNAGFLIHKPFEETGISEMIEVYRVNVFAVSELTRVMIPFLTRGSHVVAISSMGGIQGSTKFPGLSAYSSSKGAVITLMELLAEEFKDRNIAFNSLALGAVQTEMLSQAFPDYRAEVTATEMGVYVADFAVTGNELFNGKVLPVSRSTP